MYWTKETPFFLFVFFFKSPSEAANLDVFFFLDFGHFLVLLET